MTHATTSRLRGLAARLASSLRSLGEVRPALVPVPVPVRRLMAFGLLPLVLVPDALAQRGGTTGRPDRSGPRRDTVVARAPERPRTPVDNARTPGPQVGRGDRTQPSTPRYDDAQRRADEQRREHERRIDEQRRQVEERQREAERRIEAQRREQEARMRDTERRIEAQRQEQEARMREAQRRAAGQGGQGGYDGYPGYGGYDDGYGNRYGQYDRYWGSSWSPVLRFRQRVRIQSDRAYAYGRESVLEIRTHYRQRTSGGSGYYGERLDLRVERLEVYQNGRYLGAVDYHDLPNGFDQVRATRLRNGELRLDNDLLLVGEAGVGFELIRFDGNDFYGSWRRQYDAVFLDLRRGSARRIGHSRLFDPYDYRGYAPVSIVPDFQDDFYGYDSYGGYDTGYGGTYGQPGYDRSRNGGYEGPVQGRSPRGATRGSGEVAPQNRPQPGTRPAPARSPRSRTVTLPGGQQVQVERETDVAPAEGGN